MTLKRLGIRKCVSSGLDLCMLTILMYFYCRLLCVIYVLSLDKLGDLLMHLSLSIIHCISAELYYIYQTVGVLIRKWLPN